MSEVRGLVSHAVGAADCSGVALQRVMREIVTVVMVCRPPSSPRARRVAVTSRSPLCSTRVGSVDGYCRCARWRMRSPPMSWIAALRRSCDPPRCSRRRVGEAEEWRWGCRHCCFGARTPLFVALNPVDRALVDAHKVRMLAEVCVHRLRELREQRRSTRLPEHLVDVRLNVLFR